MSAGEFTIAGYEADYGAGTAIHPIKVQPETQAMVINGVVNTGVDTSNINNPISAQVSKGKRSLGLHARTVTIKFTEPPPTGYKTGQLLRIPLIGKDMKAVAVRGATGTYLGKDIQVVSNYSSEVVR